MLPWPLGSAARRLAKRAASASSVARSRPETPAGRRRPCPLSEDGDDPQLHLQRAAVPEDVHSPPQRPDGRRLSPLRRAAPASISPSHRRRFPPPPVKASAIAAQSFPPPQMPETPTSPIPDASPGTHPFPHHMAPGLLRPASPRHHLAAPPCAADSGRSRGTVTIGDSRTRNVALSVGGASRREFSCPTKALRDHSGLTRQLLDFQHDTTDEKDGEHDPFRVLKTRFLEFKQQNYVENFTNYQHLAQQQTPEFMVIACADSRVCPTSILGLQPGEAFTVRNVANLVPPYEHGASETTAALEFAVTSLEVPNVLVVGHSRCGGIQALMSMKSKKDDSDSRTFIRDWVSIGKSARLSTEAAAGNLNFEMQCRHCEKESINSSLLNLLTFPWIEKRVNEGTLSLHGGYYNFVDCTFEKWTLVYRQGLEGGSKYAIRNRSTWS